MSVRFRLWWWWVLGLWWSIVGLLLGRRGSVVWFGFSISWLGCIVALLVWWRAISLNGFLRWRTIVGLGRCLWPLWWVTFQSGLWLLISWFRGRAIVVLRLLWRSIVDWLRLGWGRSIVVSRL